LNLAACFSVEYDGERTAIKKSWTADIIPASKLMPRNY
jgi:hypothetical protein